MITEQRKIQKLANSIARKSGYGIATEIVFGNVSKPKILKASSFYYTTKNGDIIFHPSAYSKKGFSNMIYNHAYCKVLLPLSIISWENI